MKGHIRQRGNNSWAVVVDLGNDPATGKRRRKWYSVKGGKRAAQRELNRVLHELDEGTHVEPSKLTVAEYLESWLEDHARHAVSAKTFERYAEIVRKHLVPALGARPIAKLAPIEIQTYYGKALTEGRRRATGGLSAQTVKHHHRVFSQALRQAVRLQLIQRNPCDAVDPPRPVRHEMQTLDYGQSAALLKAAEGGRHYLPILLALTTGMRRGEVLGLRWRDVDLEHDVLSVTQTLEQTKEGIAFKAPKTPRSRRSIELTETTILALRAHRARQAEEKLRAGRAWQDHGLVCARELGEPMIPRDLTKAFQRLCKREGLTLRFHDLRHTHLTHLMAEGTHPKIASERAGHSSVAITLDLYSHVIPGMQRDAADKVDAALRKALEE